MKLLYDSQIFINQKTGGISRYHYELYKRICNNGHDAVIAGKFIKNRYLLNDLQFKRLFYNDSTASFAFFNKKIIKNKIRKGNYDIFHPTIACDYFVDIIPKNKKVVFTIHDMIREKQCPDSGLVKLKMAQRADRIITVSQASKDDVVEMWGIDENKISVVYHGSSMNPELANDININTPPAKYVLYVGDRGGYKNFETLARAFAIANKKNPELFLVVVGRPFSKEEIIFLENLGITDKTILYSNITDNNLAYLYLKAMAFIFPSFSEGFGLPILESWSCGTPVILSNIPCFNEVAETSGYYIEPSSPDSIADAICNIIEDDLLSGELVRRGFERLKLFSWERNYEQTLSVYKSLF